MPTRVLDSQFANSHGITWKNQRCAGDKKLTGFLDRVYSLLPKNGLFIFDAVSDFFCKHFFNGYSENEVINSKFAYQRRSYFDTLKSLQINDFTIYTDDGIFEEKHIQKIYPFSQMEQVIRTHSSFQLVAIFEDFSFFTADNESNRAHFILKKSDSS